MTDESPRLVDLRVQLDPRVNFAMQQNDVPVVKAVRIENRTDATLRDLEVRVSAEPAFAEDWTARVAAVGPRATYHLDAVDLELSPRVLGELTERVRGQLRAEVRHDGKILARCVAPLELLARDEWGGLSSLPELLAAFVLPNDPAVERLLRAAAELMAHWTGDPSLNGYQSQDPRRVYTMAAAVYGALQQLALTYVTPPASFEDEGQRVRLPGRIVESRLATCLDLALLAAGCLEQAGLNALIVVVRNHAFTGVWLRDESFPEPAVDDGVRLRKRVDLNELVVFDPTGVTTRPTLGFERAVAEAKRHLAADETFVCAIDVRRARKGRIRPLPERATAHGATAGPTPTAEGNPAAPDVSALEVLAEPGAAKPEPGGAADAAPGADAPATRVDRWRRKLLDLSLRNRLVNFRDTKKTLPLLCPDLGALEDMLADGVTFRILPRPADLGERDPRDPAAHRRRTGQEAVEELLRDELKARRLYANTTPAELDRRLVEIYRAARLGLEEGGASTLYLAIGFLAWYETNASQERRLSPILLLPLELHRSSVREAFTLRLADDDPRINVTLLELLQQDHGLVIPGLDPLPEDDSGLDVPKILRTVRQAVRDVDRWEVVDEARIGLLSFTKFLMWRDLSERVGDLMQSPVVEHLVNRPDQPFDPGARFPCAERLDEERAPTETFCPLPADSSQLAAVFAAAEGRSFVLEGPPGTGKSQTITNLIAHCLTEGKTILFVSEKMAALNVVHRRLVSVGLGRYCLELHSNKAHKRDVIGQLEEALQRPDAPGEAEWEREAHRVAELRDQLNAYVQALHVRRSTGETVFQATSRLIGLREVPGVELRWPAPDALDSDGLAALRDLVARLATAGAACGDVTGHPWAAVRKTDWTSTWQAEVHRAIARLGDAARALAERARACSDRLGLGETDFSLSQLDLIGDVVLALMTSPAPPAALVTRPEWDEIERRVTGWIERGLARDRLRAELRERFHDDIVRLDLDDLRARARRSEAAWWPTSWWRRRPIREALRGVAVEGKEPPKHALRTVLDRARTLREEQRRLDAASDEARALLGRHWNDGEAEWDAIARVRDWARELRALARRAAGDDVERDAALRAHWARLASESRAPLRREAGAGRELIAYGEALDAFKTVRRQVVELLDLDVERAWGADAAPGGADAAPGALARVESSVAGWQAAARQLRDWCAWRRARADAVRNALAPLVEAYEQGAIRSAQLRPVFERGYTEWWLGAVTDGEPVLSQFFSPEHERKIEQFRALDERYMQLTRRLCQARLAQRVPATSTSVLPSSRPSSRPSSEMGILRREVGKRRGHLSVRQLLTKIPHLLPRLKPCLLMSPMSVAQYLDAGSPPFDVVVFDEASQIPVWDAVGAIARGRQAVIVGDPKQLPPTTFFQRVDDDEDADADDVVVEDLESILDDCLSAQIPWLPLDWHYRSRHESLITFSNYHYYGNRLLTFPSPALEGLGVSWRHVPGGVYDKGKDRTNRAEAEAVVDEVLRRLRSPALAKHSIGVVTFSQAQQTLIEDLLDAARADDQALDPHFAEDGEEPIFVKNLENVQGDERDVILFSICYGPDASGRVSMNFGPMNHEGGERRLNVAITRARREVVVFSTLTADQIDLARSRARGVRDLKRFLEYAERGPAAMAEAVPSTPDADVDSAFEAAVFAALAAQGWIVHRHVGSARYRLDLAIVDPEAAGRYLLGIECDGPGYHRAKTARDRDTLRAGVLAGLGWNLHRVWSIDWWTDPEREMHKLEQALARARLRDDSTRGADVPAPAPAPEHEVSTPAPAPPRDGIEPYPSVASVASAGSPAEFYEPRAVAAIRARLLEVVRREGPISLPLAARRVAAAWGIERVRSRTVERIRDLIPETGVRLHRHAGEFLWPSTLDPAGYAKFRVPDGHGRGARPAEDLPLEEIANAALHILAHHLGAPRDEVVRETARLFGFQRRGRLVDERIRQGIEGLVARGLARLEGGVIVLGHGKTS